MPKYLDITAAITAYRRIDTTLETIRQIMSCRPQPGEVIVHVDGNQTACARAIKANYPEIEVILSTRNVGPGGGRNKLISAARYDLIGSFDDDSYPFDRDYFARAWQVMQSFPEAALVTGTIIHPHDTIVKDVPVVIEVFGFCSCGTVFRKSKLFGIEGFVPLAVAYGMEEEDLALQLLDRGRILLESPWLRIYHATNLSHHARPEITAGVIANLALLAYLRYPPIYWPYSVLQIANRIIWCLKAGRRKGILSGLVMVPLHLWRHKKYRKRVSGAAMRRKLAARRVPSGHHMPIATDFR